MSLVEPLVAYRQYRAPKNHGEEFSDPPVSSAPALTRENIARLRQYPIHWCGLPAARALSEAREELIRLAHDYTRQYRDVEQNIPGGPDISPVILCGHQPELFHPGVWLKNFVLGCLGRSLRGTAINLIADNDVISSATIRVPTGTVATPRMETVAYDAPTDELPSETRRLLNPEMFASFGQRVETRMRSFDIDPLIRRWWPTAVAASRRVNNLGRCLAEARHVLEGEWGNQTLEVPLSLVCETNSFRRFSAHLLDDFQKLNADYNGALLEYRRANKIRSRTHPVSELLRQDEWYEIPFWIWTSEDPRRKRPFARRRAGGIELTDRESIRFTIAGGTQDDGQVAVESLAEMAAQGIKLRPRALLTTMFARLMLSDLFLHGIGGGKYDQLTDAIMRRFFGIDPPRFIVLTATAHLPIAKRDAEVSDLHKIDSILRDFEFNPDRHVDVTDESRRWIEEKQKWLATEIPTGSRRERHRGIVNANRALQPYVAEQRSQMMLERDRLAVLVDHNKLLGSREFAFCLFPEDTLRALLLDKC